MTITDFGGAPRIIGSNVDLGAYEFQPPDFLSLEVEPSSQTVAVGQTAAFSITAISPDPLSYQWVFDGTNIAGANNSSCSISDVQSNNAGAYSVVISNAVTSANIVSSNAVLTVIPPVITVEPAYQAVMPGSTAMFSANAAGYGSVGLQWEFNGINIPGATNTVLILTNADSSESGTYSVTVSSPYGLVTSANVTLSVSPIIAWGDNTSGETTIPTSVSNAVMISASYFDAFALIPGGTVVAWGADGDNVPAGLSNVVEISAGSYHCLALKSDGTVAAWGNDSYGQTSVPGGLSNVVAVAGGGSHSLALQSDGMVAAWGWNDFGESTVPAGLSNVVAIAAGSAYSLALLTDGTVTGWGYNHDGEIAIPAGLSNVVAIAAGSYFGMALRADGTVVAWGDNSYGETIIPIGLSNVVAIAANGYHCLAERNDGSIVAWGDNSGSQNDIPTGLANVVMIASGGPFNLALTGFGPPSVIVPSLQLTILGGQTVFVPGIGLGLNQLYFQWQLNGTNLPGANGPLLTLVGTQALSGLYSLTITNAYGTVTSSNVVLNVIPLVISNSPSSQTVLAGTNVTFGVTAIGWGPFSYQWQYGGVDLLNATNASLDLTNVQPSQAGEYSVAVANAFGIVVSSNSLLGIVPIEITTQPQQQLTSIGGSASFMVTAALEGPFTYQWQMNGNPIPSATNDILVLTNLQFNQAGSYSVVVQNGIGMVVSSNATLTVSQQVPWGLNNYGQASLQSALTNIMAISAGGYHDLALAGNGNVIAWGQNFYGQASVPTGLSNVVSVAAGGYHSMALTGNGTITAWGWDNLGQTTIPGKLSNVVAIAAGYYHSVALTSNGGVIAWGYDGYGETGGSSLFSVE
jgi:alpha-tubulin suppressor-like RCC1 family protein